MQKDLKLSLNMGDTLEQPLPLTASANEVTFQTLLTLLSAKFCYFFVIFSLITVLILYCQSFQHKANANDLLVNLVDKLNV